MTYPKNEVSLVIGILSHIISLTVFFRGALPTFVPVRVGKDDCICLVSNGMPKHTNFVLRNATAFPSTSIKSIPWAFSILLRSFVGTPVLSDVLQGLKSFSLAIISPV